MKKNLLIVACIAIISVALVYGQAATPQTKAAAPASKAQTTAAKPAAPKKTS